MKIRIKRNPVADTRTCDWNKVSQENLYEASRDHIRDVKLGLELLCRMLDKASLAHDSDKLTDISGFHADFRTGFANHSWWDNHRKVSRHHLLNTDGVPHDVNLIDVLECITDCVMAGLARSGKVYDVILPNELLQKAVCNTFKMLIDAVEVEG
jgi:hypothetical protein